MQRDLVEHRGWFTREEYLKSLALSPLAPGPLAAQLTICLGYVHSRVRGATLVALAFILASFVMTVGIGSLYVRYGRLTWMQAAFYGVGAAVIGNISRAAWKLASLTLARDRWQNAQVKAFVTGVTAAASGAIAGACVVLARRAVIDIPTLSIAGLALGLGWRSKVPEPLLIAGGAAAGLFIIWARG